VKCVKIVNSTRRAAYGDDRLAALELNYEGKAKMDCFLMFSAMWVDDKGTQRVFYQVIEI
jgi:hypothetical protein